MNFSYCTDANLLNFWCFREFIDYHVEHTADPRTKNWLLLQESPKYCLQLSGLYLLMVLLGPKVMEHRPAFNLKWLMVIYNFALVALSLHMLTDIIWSAFKADYGLVCNKYNTDSWTDPMEYKVASALWLFFFSKAIEFADTLFMIARKKFEQVTFLHVYHHVTMINLWFYVMMWMPGGIAVFSSSMNCFVHVWMYAYYGLSLFPSMRPYLWWKKYLTNLQLIQFTLILTHTLYVSLTPCDFPWHGKLALSSYMISLLVLFGNFYMHAYIRGKRLLPGKGKQLDDENKNQMKNDGGDGAVVANGEPHGYLEESATNKKDS